ncbi:uncharacterized protein BXZ73DRAFT_102375 [Epithele typhae]|uniref:uncharacterized protein n=1 Tax=Epithele typhae TaxID=378194 RepID=UPI002007B8AC|nr:uncharacterized protein BXZ73DRAFT_102375 [Epithele typhae]KAH9928539.1 hypothetical protein BXZ73DRAFT_102375 [Epithele typhae]
MKLNVPDRKFKEKDVTDAWLCPNHTFQISTRKADKNETTKSELDGGFFHINDTRFLSKGVPSWDYSRFPVEFKNGKSLDDSLSRLDVYTLVVNGPEFRLLYWDRSERLLRLLVDLSRLRDEDAGLDPTAHRLSQDSCGYLRMSQVAEADSFDLDEQYTTTHNPTKIPAGLRDVRCDCKPFASDGDYSDPRKTMDGDKRMWPVPRGTFKYVRKFFRDSLEDNALRYMLEVEGKYYLRAEPEHDILRKLNEAELPGVPTLVASETYAGQLTHLSLITGVTNPAELNPSPSNPLSPSSSSATASQMHSPPHVFYRDLPFRLDPSTFDSCANKSATDAGADPGEDVQGVRHFQHVRMVVDEFCLPLSAFRCGHDLVSAIFDAILAHQRAYNDCNLLHRDISAGNILLLPRLSETADGKLRITWNGILTDWEMAKGISPIEQRQHVRTGTWAFMSVLCQIDATRTSEVSDELESFFHVLVYMVLTRMRINWTASIINDFVADYFHHSRHSMGGGQTCSLIREMYIKDGVLEASHTPLQVHSVDDEGERVFEHPMNELLSSLLGRFRARFLVHQWDRRNPSAAHPDPTITVLRQAAEHLNTHNATLEMLKDYRDREDWPREDMTTPPMVEKGEVYASSIYRFQ